MKLKVNNIEIFASTGGRLFDKNKPVIIFLHGSGFDHTVWMLQTRYFAFHGYSILALDLPGHGLSEGNSLTSIEDMAEWVNNVIEVVGGGAEDFHGDWTFSVGDGDDMPFN